MVLSFDFKHGLVLMLCLILIKKIYPLYLQWSFITGGRSLLLLLIYQTGKQTVLLTKKPKTVIIVKVKTITDQKALLNLHLNYRYTCSQLLRALSSLTLTTSCTRLKQKMSERSKTSTLFWFNMETLSLTEVVFVSSLLIGDLGGTEPLLLHSQASETQRVLLPISYMLNLPGVVLGQSARTKHVNSIIACWSEKKPFKNVFQLNLTCNLLSLRCFCIPLL